MIADTVNFSVSKSDDAVWLKVAKDFPPPHFSLGYSSNPPSNWGLLLSLDDQERLKIRAEEALWGPVCNLPTHSQVVALASRRILSEAPRAPIVFIALVL